MAIKTTLEQIEEVQTAISRIIGGAQSWMMGDTRVTEADLGKLEERERRLLAIFNRTKNRGGRLLLNISDGP